MEGSHTNKFLMCFKILKTQGVHNNKMHKATWTLALWLLSSPMYTHIPIKHSLSFIPTKLKEPTDSVCYSEHNPKQKMHLGRTNSEIRHYVFFSFYS